MGGVFPFVGEFDIVVCMGGLYMVCFYMCVSYSF